MISSSAKVRGVTIARDAGIETMVVRKSDHPDPERVLPRRCSTPAEKPVSNLVVMAGFLKHVLIPDDFAGRVINIHPSLLPSFGGPGMYGHHVHQAVIDRGVKISGCTVHYVDNEYDNGPIILQRSCEVKRDDTAETLAARVFEQECRAIAGSDQNCLADIVAVSLRRDERPTRRRY